MKRSVPLSKAFSLDRRIKTAVLLEWILEKKWVQFLLLMANAGFAFIILRAKLSVSGAASSLFYGFLFSVLEVLLLAISIMAEIPAEMIVDALFPRDGE